MNQIEKKHNFNSATIISDIHIGSQACNSDAILEVLDNIDTELLVINGDLFDSFDGRLVKKQWKILSKIRKLSDDIEIVWVTGNHDESNPELIASLIGVQLVPEYRFSFNGKKVICIHGHIWDKFITDHPILTNIADYIYQIFQKLDKQHKIARWLKHTSKAFLRNKDIIRTKALEYCNQEEYDIIMCGHTHFAEEHINLPIPGEYRGGVYYNSGCFTENPCSYIVMKDNKIEIIRNVH